MTERAQLPKDFEEPVLLELPAEFLHQLDGQLELPRGPLGREMGHRVRPFHDQIQQHVHVDACLGHVEWRGGSELVSPSHHSVNDARHGLCRTGGAAERVISLS